MTKRKTREELAKAVAAAEAAFYAAADAYDATSPYCIDSVHECVCDAYHAAVKARATIKTAASAYEAEHFSGAEDGN